jgi:hypothetical protein
MKVILALVFLSLFLTGCTSYSTEAQNQTNLIETNNSNLSKSNQNSDNSVYVKSLNPANEQEIAEIEAIKQKEREEQERIPPEFKKVDFKNFTYQSILGNGKFKLKDGEFEKVVKSGNKYAAIGENWRVSFGAVDFVDFNNDSKKEAIVELSETQSAGSSYTAFGYKVFVLKNDKPVLIWETATGSESSCGHKQISIENNKIFLEVFGICKKSNSSSENYDGDMFASNFTRFTFGWNGKKIIQENREVFPYPENDVYMNLYKNTLENSIQH